MKASDLSGIGVAPAEGTGAPAQPAPATQQAAVQPAAPATKAGEAAPAQPAKPTDGAPTAVGKDGGKSQAPADGTAPGSKPDETVPASRLNDVTSLYHTEQTRVQAFIKAMGATNYEDALIVAAQLASQKKVATQEQPEELPAYHREDWEPKTLKEVREALISAEQRGFKLATEAIHGEQQTKQQVAQALDNAIASFKSQDPEFDEDSYYAFAREHDFPLANPEHLKSVFSAYRAVRDARKAGEGRARENIAERATEPVNNPGGGQGAPAGTPYSEVRKHASVHDAAMAAFHKGK